MKIKFKLRNLKHNLANFGSVGHLICLSLQNKMAENNNKIPAAINISILYFDILVIHGNKDIKPAKLAPIPSIIINAGKAQHINVLKLVNRLSVGAKNCLKKLLITINLRYIVTRIIN